MPREMPNITEMWLSVEILKPKASGMNDLNMTVWGNFTQIQLIQRYPLTYLILNISMHKPIKLTTVSLKVCAKSGLELVGVIKIASNDEKISLECCADARSSSHVLLS